MYRKKGFLLSAALLLTATSAQATLLDFTASNTNTVTEDGVTATVAGSGALTYQPFDGGVCPTGLLACNNDGIGIRDDEVTFSSEYLIVSFSQLVDVTAIHVLDLFGVGDDGAGNPQELASYAFLDATNTLISIGGMGGTAAPGTMGGYQMDSLLVSGVSSIVFYTATPGYENSDFALAGIEFTSVPEPATLSLLGSGLIGLGWVGRRRKKRA